MTDSVMNSEHNVEIKNRNNISISGISGVNSFDDNQISMTLCGGEALIVEGENLDIKEVNLQKCLLEATGLVTGLFYDDLTGKAKSGFIKNLFSRA